MEKYEEAFEAAKKHLHTADHILTQTYPLVNDPKLLLSVMESTFLSLTNAMGAVLYIERANKRVPPYQDTFDSKFRTFKEHIARKANIPNEELAFLLELKEMLISHKQSPLEFSRKGKFVICSDELNVKTISKEDMQQYLDRAKVFIQAASRFIDHHTR